jgi:predicted metal-dependent hydrolase
MKRQYKDIPYTLTRSRRKTASIHIERDGQVSILVPTKLSDAEVDDLIEKKLVWIYKNLAEWCDMNATQVEREFVNGEGFLYLGRSYRLKLVEDQTAPSFSVFESVWFRPASRFRHMGLFAHWLP